MMCVRVPRPVAARPAAPGRELRRFGCERLVGRSVGYDRLRPAGAAGSGPPVRTARSDRAGGLARRPRAFLQRLTRLTSDKASQFKVAA